MPTVLRWNGYRFYFFSNEGFEPPHIHVDKGEFSAKFWLVMDSIRYHRSDTALVRVTVPVMHNDQGAATRAGVAFVPEGRGIFASLNVTENLVMAARAAPAGRTDWTLERIFDLFPRLAERRRHWGNQLSGGEQQMLTIGRALMTNPDLILIDEAAEGLAPMVAQTIWQTLLAIRAEGVAALVVDKDFRALSRLADRVLLMAKGEFVFSGTPMELCADYELLEKHLGI